MLQYDRTRITTSEGSDIEEYITDDTQKVVWVIHVPKHLPKRPVYAHDKAWQRIEDSLVEMSNEGSVIQKDRTWYATTSKD